MMKRLFVLLILCSLMSCAKKNTEPVSAQDSGIKAEVQSDQTVANETPSGEPGNNRPIRLGDSSEEKVSAPAPTPKKVKKNTPEINAVQDNMKQLLLNSGTAVLPSTDMDIGLLPISSKDPVDMLSRDFLTAVFFNRKYESFIDASFVKAMTNIVATLRSSITVDEFRQGEKHHHGTGYVVPFRIFSGNLSGIGSVMITSKDGKWFVQDLLFDVENIKEREEEPFAPSLYRWMEVY